MRIQLEIIFRGFGNVGRGPALQIVVHHHQRCIRIRRCVDWRAAADHVGVAEAVGPRHHLPLERVQQDWRVRSYADTSGSPRAQRQQQQFAVGRKHLDGPEVVFLLMLLNEIAQV